MIELRPYQQSLVDRARESMQHGHRAPLLVSPSGSGKTVCFSYLAAKVKEKDKRILILAHRDELIDQISRTLREFQVEHSFIAAGRPYNSRHQVHVGSVMSVLRRLSRLNQPHLIIQDEAHHSVARSWRTVLSAFPLAFRLGVTATPERLSGEPLKDVFDDLILGPTVQELIGLGNLSTYRIYAPNTINTGNIHIRAGDFAKDELAIAADKPSITGDAINEYKKLCLGKQAVAFCVSVEHARNVAAQFVAEGFPAACLDGSLDREVRHLIVKEFREAKLKVLTSCEILSEGFDVPAIEAAIMLRPTQSLALWLQQAGRALRPWPNKHSAFILDHSGNCLRHGLPDEERQWSLEERESNRKKEETSRSVRVCPICFAAQYAGRSACQFCHHVFEIKPREVEQREGELQEVDPEVFRKVARQEQGMASDVRALVELGRKRGYRNPWGWAHFVMRGRYAKRQEEQRKKLACAL